MSQAILLETFPPEKRGLAMGIFGMGVVVGPILGPIVGGLILGIAEALGSHWFGSTYADLISFSMLVAVLIFRPKGILGGTD